MYIALVFLSFFGAIVAGIFGRFLGARSSGIITTGSLFISLCFSLFVFYEVAILNSFVYLKLATWVISETLHIDWGFLFDSLTAIMCVVVTFISLFVHLYSMEYMAHDPHLPRFMSYLSIFTFFMLILVTADNLLQMFLGWEGIGLASYLLINFWFTRIQANKAAIKAMVVNRIGDFFLIISLLIVFIFFKSLDYSTLAVLTPFFKNHTIDFLNLKVNLIPTISFFLFLGAVGKSAQLGLHTWLPDAMEGPTPVSSLIHAATLVTAGVYLIVRTSFFFDESPNIIRFVAVLGAMTAFVSATIGLLQNDLKRVIAYSTCSQLGYMIFACGLSNYPASIFHLSNHAFFKALLFLSAGSIIHGMNDEQDLRRFGGLKNLLPFTYSMVIIGSLALIGFPFLAGFYSKDLILEAAYSTYNLVGYFCYFLGTMGAFFTSFYSTRLLYLTFLANPMGQKPIIMMACDSQIKISLALAFLSLPSLFLGYYMKDMIVGLGSSFFDTSIFIRQNYYNIFDAEFLDSFHKTLPINFSMVGVGLAFILYSFRLKLLYNLKISTIGQKTYNFLNRKWFFDKIYNEYLGQFFFKVGYSFTYKFVDRGVFEIIGPTGLSVLIMRLGSNFHNFQTNSIYHMTLTILVSISVLFTFRQGLIFISYIDYKTIIIIFILFLFSISFLNNSKKF
jgi:NADH-ubiquinone oxidoreductase chain 5